MLQYGQLFHVHIYTNIGLHTENIELLVKRWQNRLENVELFRLDLRSFINGSLHILDLQCIDNCLIARNFNAFHFSPGKNYTCIFHFFFILLILVVLLVSVLVISLYFVLSQTPHPPCHFLQVHHAHRHNPYLCYCHLHNCYIIRHSFLWFIPLPSS